MFNIYYLKAKVQKIFLIQQEFVGKMYLGS